MIERLYVNYFRCFENFSIDLANRSSALVIGKNGAGKSTFLHALGVFQNIGRGAGRVRFLINKRFFEDL
jgi:predicted ATPase